MLTNIARVTQDTCPVASILRTTEKHVRNMALGAESPWLRRTYSRAAAALQAERIFGHGAACRGTCDIEAGLRDSRARLLILARDAKDQGAGAAAACAAYELKRALFAFDGVFTLPAREVR